MGEESGRSGDIGPENYVWVVDPIDGTANYARGIPHWCISVALMRAGRVELGYVYDPCAREIFTARRGRGARLNGRKISVSEVLDVGKARVNVGFSYRRPPELHSRGIRILLERGIEYSRLASGALGMSWVACGRFDAYWETHINSWDVLAGLLIVEEAGGWVSEFLSGKGFLEGNPILAAAPGIGAELRRLLEPLNEEARLWKK